MRLRTLKEPNMSPLKVRIERGYVFCFQRRRYANTTYTWGFVKRGEDWLALGDPWPAVTFRRKELIEAAERRLANPDPDFV